MPHAFNWYEMFVKLIFVLRIVTFCRMSVRCNWAPLNPSVSMRRMHYCLTIPSLTFHSIFVVFYLLDTKCSVVMNAQRSHIFVQIKRILAYFFFEVGQRSCAWRLFSSDHNYVISTLFVTTYWHSLLLLSGPFLSCVLNIWLLCIELSIFRIYTPLSNCLYNYQIQVDTYTPCQKLYNAYAWCILFYFFCKD